MVGFKKDTNPNYRHGGTYKNRSEYNSWRAMKERCNNPNSIGYKRYGGRGIKVCDQWNSPTGFVDFLKDMGVKPTPKHSIDRINNNGDYTPNNCRWALPRQQVNNSSVVRKVKVDGKTKTVTEHAKDFGIDISTVYWRMRNLGLNHEEAIKYKHERDTNSLRYIAERSGINYNTLHTRVIGGMSVEEAVSKPVERKRFSVVVDGIEASVRGHCRRLGINRHKVQKLTDSGIAPQQAISRVRERAS